MVLFFLISPHLQHTAFQRSWNCFVTTHYHQGTWQLNDEAAADPQQGSWWCKYSRCIGTACNYSLKSILRMPRKWLIIAIAWAKVQLLQLKQAVTFTFAVFSPFLWRATLDNYRQHINPPPFNPFGCNKTSAILYVSAKLITWAEQ